MEKQGNIHLATMAHRILYSVARQIADTNGSDTDIDASYGLGGDSDPTNDMGADADAGSSGETDFDRNVFWGVNGFLLLMLVTMGVWCCFCKKDWLINPHERRARSDEAFQRRVRERHERYKASKIVTPEQRRQRLLDSFMRHGVTMVRTK